MLKQLGFTNICITIWAVIRGIYLMLEFRECTSKLSTLQYLKGRKKKHQPKCRVLPATSSVVRTFLLEISSITIGT